jgi:hypothetical protein
MIAAAHRPHRRTLPRGRGRHRRVRLHRRRPDLPAASARSSCRRSPRPSSSSSCGSSPARRSRSTTPSARHASSASSTRPRLPRPMPPKQAAEIRTSLGDIEAERSPHPRRGRGPGRGTAHRRTQPVSRSRWPSSRHAPRPSSCHRGQPVGRRAPRRDLAPRRSCRRPRRGDTIDDDRAAATDRGLHQSCRRRPVTS